jgi:hypothetical protein
LAANLAAGELAINTTDGKLYYKSNAGVVTLIAGSTSGPAGGSNTQVQYNSSGVLAGSANMTFNGTTLTVAGLSNTGNTTLGDASADTVTVNGTITSNLIFTDNTYDIGASGATRPRNLYLSGKAGIGVTPIQNAILSVNGTGTETTSSATVRTTAPFIITPYSGSAWGTAIGSITGQIQYIQGTDTSTTGVKALSLNPFGANVGINMGVDAPAASLHIEGSGTSGQVTGTFMMQNTSSGTFGMDITGSAGSSALRLLYGATAGTGTNSLTAGINYVLEGTNAGNFGIGVSPPAYKLDVSSGALNGVVANFQATYTNTYGTIRITGNNRGGEVDFYNGSTAQAAIVGGTGNLYFYTNGNSTLQATLDSVGNLGIGRSPTAAGTYRILELDGATGGYVRLYAAGTQSGYWYSSAVESGIGSKTSAPFLFYTNDTERGRFSASGNFSVGATNEQGRIGSYYAGKASFAGVDTSAYAAGVGGTIDLGGNYRSSNDYSPFVRIAAEKTNATNGDYGYNMGFYVTSYPNSTFGVKAITIFSTGIVAVNPNGGGTGNKLAIYGGGGTGLGALQISDGDVSGATNSWNIGRDNILTGDFTFALNSNIFWRMTTAGQWNRKLTTDLTAISVQGSYTGNPELIAIGQSSSDGFMQIWDASRATSTRLQAFASNA